jgi:hypothetical protein
MGGGHNYSVRFWSFGRMYVLPALDRDTARATYEVLKTGFSVPRCEWYQGMVCLDTFIRLDLPDLPGTGNGGTG